MNPYYGVALAHEAQQRVELRSLGVLARRLIGEYLVYLGVFQLACRVLVEAADPDVADALTGQGVLLGKVSGRTL